VPLIVNGKQHPVPAPATVLGLLQSKGLDPATVVVELNTAIVQGPDFATTPLAPGDRLEILSFVGGG